MVNGNLATPENIKKAADAMKIVYDRAQLLVQKASTEGIDSEEADDMDHLINRPLEEWFYDYAVAALSAIG